MITGIAMKATSMATRMTRNAETANQIDDLRGDSSRAPFVSGAPTVSHAWVGPTSRYGSSGALAIPHGYLRMKDAVMTLGP